MRFIVSRTSFAYPSRFSLSNLICTEALPSTLQTILSESSPYTFSMEKIRPYENYLSSSSFIWITSFLPQ